MNKIKQHIADLLCVSVDAIKEIVEVEPKIHTALVQQEDKLISYLYSEVEGGVTEIPEAAPESRKQYLTEDEKTEYYLENKRLIAFALKKISKPDGVDFTELEGVGTYGFVKALNTFNKSNGTKFSTYAVKCVLNEVYYFLRKEQKHLMMTDSLDEVIASDNNGNKLTIGDTISNTVRTGEKSTEEKILLEELRKTLLQCIDCLPNDEQYLIIYRYGLDNNIIKTQTEIAETLNMSQANISKLEKTCLKKLRTILRKNNYIYDAKTKKLDSSGLPIFDLLTMDDNENYLDRDSRENIEVGVCSCLGTDITEVVDVKPTSQDHTYLVTFSKNNRVGVLYNNISNRYTLTEIPLSRQDKFLYLALGIPLKSNFDKNDLMDEKYQLNISDKEFKKVFSSLDKTTQHVLTHRYGLFEKPIKICSDLAKELKMSENEVYKICTDGMRTFSHKLKNSL